MRTPCIITTTTNTRHAIYIYIYFCNHHHITSSSFSHPRTPPHPAWRGHVNRHLHRRRGAFGCAKGYHSSLVMTRQSGPRMASSQPPRHPRVTPGSDLRDRVHTARYIPHTPGRGRAFTMDDDGGFRMTPPVLACVVREHGGVGARRAVGDRVF